MGSISLNNLSLTLGTELFRNLDLVVSDGDRVGLVAANGAGKSSLLRIIAGELEPSEGDITRSRGLTIGHVEQEVPAALMELSLRDAVAAALPAEQREIESWRADVALDGFETPWELRDRPVGALSGGWQRLMLIARMWVAEPDALLMDEPTNHLDLGKIMVLEDWLNREARGVPMIVASHDLRLTAYADRVLRMEDGRIVAVEAGGGQSRAERQRPAVPLDEPPGLFGDGEALPG